MSAARLPLAYRDSCAHLLIPLNKCRFDNYYLPWRCEVCFPIPQILENTQQNGTYVCARRSDIRQIPPRRERGRGEGVLQR